MKKVMKKTLSFILTIAMVLTSLTVSDWSREEVKAANQTLYYNFQKVSSLSTGSTYLFCTDSNLTSTNAYVSIPSGSATLQITNVAPSETDGKYYSKSGRYVNVIGQGNGFDGCPDGKVIYASSSSDLFSSSNWGGSGYYYACNYGGSSDCGPYTVYTYSSTTNYTINAQLKEGKKPNATGATTFTSSDLIVTASIPGQSTKYSISSFSVTDGIVNPSTGDNTITVLFNGVSASVNVSFPVTKECFTLSNNTKEYNGQNQVPTISKQTSVGEITKIEYNKQGTTTYFTEVKDAAVYDVYVSTAVSDKYEAGSRVKIGTFTITPKTINGTVSVQDKVYDGTDNATSQTQIYVNEDELNGDSLSVTVTDAKFDTTSTNVGKLGKDVAYDEDGNVVEKNVTVNSYTLSNENYELNLDTTNAKAKIYPKNISDESLNVQVDDSSYIWDGTVKTPVITIRDTATNETLIPFTEKSSNDDYYDYTVTGTQSHKNLGNYTVKIIGHGNYVNKVDADWCIHTVVTGYEGVYDGASHGITIENYPEYARILYATSENGTYSQNEIKYKDVGNYLVYYKVIDTKTGKIFTGSKDVIITKKTISLSWENTSFEYDGTDKKPSAIADNLEQGDKVAIIVSGAKSDVGIYTATATEITGISAGNYQLPAETTQEFSIFEKEVTVTWEEATIEYNGKVQGPDALLNGVVEGDSCDAIITGYGKNAGTYTASVTGLTNSNYVLAGDNLTKQYSITKKLLTEENVSLTPSYYYYRYGIERTPVILVEDIVDSENIIAITDYFTYGDTSAEEPGVYTIYICASAGGNYFGEVEKTWTVEKHVGDITFAENLGKEYDGTPYVVDDSLYSLVVGTDEEGRVLTEADYSTDVTVEYKQKDASDNTYTQTAPEKAGDYTVRVTIGTNDNYYETVKECDFTIERKAVEVNWGANNFVYDGNEQAPTASITNLIGSDEASVTVSGAKKNAGDYVATIDGITGKDAGNYKVEGEITKNYSIAKKEVTISWGTTNFTYDGKKHLPTATVAEGLVAGDSVNVAVEGEQTKAGEGYIATATGLDNDNYIISGSNTTTFTIEKAKIITSANNVTVVFDGKPHTVKVDVLKPVDNYTIRYSTDTGSQKNYNLAEIPEYTSEGEHFVYYKIDAENYETYYGSAVVKIEHGTLTASAQNVEATYDGNAKLINVITSIEGASITYSSSEDGTYTLEQPKVVNAGVTTVYYKVSYENYPDFIGSATITINKVKLVVTAIDQAVKKGASISNKLSMVQAKDLVNGENISSVKLKADTSKITTNGKITVKSVVVKNGTKTTTGNYDVKYVSGKLVVYEASSNNNDINKGVKASQTGKDIDIKWSKVAGADGYEVYVAYCGKKYSKTAAVVNSKDKLSAEITKIDNKSINLKNNYKIYVTAFKLQGEKKVTIAKSIDIHLVGKNNKKYSNVKSIILKRTKIPMKIGQYATVKGKVKLYNSKKKLLNHTSKFRFVSSNPKIASVSAKGKITAKKKGTCKIYVYACNGCTKTVTVTVK